MQIKYEGIMQETDRRVSVIDLNGKHIIKDCKTIIVFLKEQLAKLKMSVQSTFFTNEAEEILFFKRHKPMLLRQLIYFHEILRIESQRPFGENELDAYYEKRQEEQKLFFNRHIAFFQYYRSGATHLDSYYFLRGQQENIIEESRSALLGVKGTYKWIRNAIELVELVYGLLRRLHRYEEAQE